MGQGLGGNRSGNQAVTSGNYRPETAEKREVGIERLLIWAYRDQRVHAAGGGYSTAAPGYSADGVATLMRTGGVMVDVSGGGFRVHDDAITVDGAIGAARALVVRHAAAGTRPAAPETLRFVPRYSDPGKGGARKPLYLYNAAAGIGNRPWLCELVQIGSAEEARHRRATYAAWRDELAHLRDLFRARPGLLTAHLVNGELPPHQIW